MFAVAGVLTWLAGTRLSAYAGEIADRTGPDKARIELLLLAVATALPEASRTIASDRLGAHGTVLSNILGKNALDASLVSLADVLCRRGQVLQAVGIVPTTAHLIGLMERNAHVVLQVGGASADVLGLYAASLVVLYLLRFAASDRAPPLAGAFQWGRPRRRHRPVRGDRRRELVGHRDSFDAAGPHHGCVPDLRSGPGVDRGGFAQEVAPDPDPADWSRAYQERG